MQGGLCEGTLELAPGFNPWGGVAAPHRPGEPCCSQHCLASWVDLVTTRARVSPRRTASRRWAATSSSRRRGLGQLARLHAYVCIVCACAMAMADDVHCVVRCTRICEPRPRHAGPRRFNLWRRKRRGHIHSDIIPSPAVRMAHHSGRLSTLAINALACQAGDWRRGAWVHGAKARRSRDTWPGG